MYVCLRATVATIVCGNNSLHFITSAVTKELRLPALQSCTITTFTSGSLSFGVCSSLHLEPLVGDILRPVSPSTEMGYQHDRIGNKRGNTSYKIYIYIYYRERGRERERERESLCSEYFTVIKFDLTYIDTGIT